MKTRTVDYTLLGAEEIAAARRLLQENNLFTASTRIAYLGLEDPNPQAPARRVRVMLMDSALNEPKDVVLDLTRNEIEQVTEIDAAAVGQLPVLEEEFEKVEAIVAADEGWIQALAKRNLTVEQVRVAPLSAGVFEYPEESGRRILRGLAFRQDFAEDSAWAHPVDGLVVYIDTVAGKVDQILDFGPVDIPADHGNYTDPELTGPIRDTQKPLLITQPEAPASPSPTATTSSGRSGAWTWASTCARAWCCTTSPSTTRASADASWTVPRSPRWSCPMATPPGAQLAELLRHRRIPDRTHGQLPGTGLRLPGRNPLHLPGGGHRRRRGPHHPQRHLHARGGLLDPLQALR